jgi:hypothetical protein
VLRSSCQEGDLAGPLLSVGPLFFDWLPVSLSSCSIATHTLQEEVRKLFEEMAGSGGGKKEAAVGAGCCRACFCCACARRD